MVVPSPAAAGSDANPDPAGVGAEGAEDAVAPDPAGVGAEGAVAPVAVGVGSEGVVAPDPACSASRVARRQSANWPNRRAATSLMAPPRPKEATLPVSWTSLVTWRRVRVSPAASRRVSTLALAVPAPLVSLPLAARRALWLASSTSSTVTLPL